MPETSLADLGARLRPPGRSLADLLMTESLLPAQPHQIDPVTRATLGGDPWKGVVTPIGQDTSLSPVNMAIGLIGGPALRGRFRDPALWHGISQVRLPRPISEMTSTHVPGVAGVERPITPSDLQGGWLLPAMGDRSVAGSTLAGVGQSRLRSGVPMQGGHGYMAAMEPEGVVWASGPSVTQIISNRARTLAESGKPVYFPYTAMGERSVDFSHHVGNTLADLVTQSQIPRSAARDFNRAMKTDTSDFKAVKDWPGITSDKLPEYMRTAAGGVRNKFAKTMDTAEFQSAGFPSVAEVRHAVTDPRLLNVPTGASGLSVGEINPLGQIITGGTPHMTYPSKVPGKYVGGFGTSVPKEVMYPDMLRSYARRGYEPVQYDYLMARPPRGTPLAQEATQKWVDKVSRWIEQNRGKAGAVGGVSGVGMISPDDDPVGAILQRYGIVGSDVGAGDEWSAAKARLSVSDRQRQKAKAQ